MSTLQTISTLEEFYIQRCLTLAARAKGLTSPNPMVGAVVLNRHGRVVGEGYHQQCGGPHAEVLALEQAGDEAHDGVLFVNLEPCNHTGKTGPCTEAIIQAGISKVYCGTLDPNPKVSGSGRDQLQNNRISVRHGYLQTECQKLNEAFFHFIQTRRPFVTIKLGLTLDGKIATRKGGREWITNELAQHYVHHLRAEHDAILTTANTVATDNPQLTVRAFKHPKRQPIRIILDRHFRLNPVQFEVFDTAVAPTWVITSNVRHNTQNAKRAHKKGIEVIEVADDGFGLDLADVLKVLGQRDIVSIMTESGGRLAGSLVTQGLAQKALLFYAPKVVADAMCPPAFAGTAQFNLAALPHFTLSHTQQLDNNLVLEAYLNPERPNGKPLNGNSKTRKTEKTDTLSEKARVTPVEIS